MTTRDLQHRSSATEARLDATPPTPTPAGRRVGPSGTPLASRVFLVSVGLAVLPVIVAVVRAIARGWVPLSDDALFAIRARDVFSYHHFPLVGLDSSASLATSTTLHHPGPLLFDVLALPVTVFGAGAGVALGIGLINVAAIVLIAVFAHRRGGPLLGAIAMTAAAGLAWTMGSEALFEPWQPFSLLLPFLCFLVLAWSVSCGDLLALPAAAVVGSLVLQTHLSYVLLVPVLAIWAVVMLVLKLRRDRNEEPVAWPRQRRQVARSVVVASSVFALCWVQPVLDQIIGQGNLGQLLSNAGPPKRTFGYGYGARVMASVVALPPWWFRPSMNETLMPSMGFTVPSRLVAAASLLGLAAVLAGCAWVAVRRRDRVASHAIGAVVVGLAAGFATAGRIPITVFGLEAHVFWWLWPLSVFIFLAVAATLARLVAARLRPALVIAFTVATAVFAGLAVPTLAQGLSPNTRESAVPTARAIDSQLGRLQGKGPILIDPLLHSRLADPYGLAVLAELQRRGIPIVAKDSMLVGQLGSARRFTGTNARSEIYLRVGDDPLLLPSGTPKVAEHQALSSREQRELSDLKTEIAGYIAEGRLRLTETGLKAVQRQGGLPADPRALFSTGELVNLVQGHLLNVDHLWARRFERFASLEGRWDANTVALYLAPLGPLARPVDVVHVGAG
ncbi:MAG TPA: hypothetical protein VG869_08830 [Acidimicrobiia bacterium]|nr:hypothetical protein [Acidimicrobiia bacterium]